MEELTPVAKSPSSPTDLPGLRILMDEELEEIDWRSKLPMPAEKECSYMRIGCTPDGHCFFHAIAKALSEPYQYSYKIHNLSGIDLNFLVVYDSYISKCKICPKHYKSHEITSGSLGICLAQFRFHYVQSFRKDLADSIAYDSFTQANIRRFMKGAIEMEADKLRYIWQGDVVKMAEIEKEESLTLGFGNLISSMISELNSSKDVKPDYILLLSPILNIDIYLIRDKNLLETTGRLPAIYSQFLHAAVRGNRESIVLISISDIHYEIICKYNHSTSKKQFIFDPSEPLIRKLYTCVSPL